MHIMNNKMILLKQNYTLMHERSVFIKHLCLRIPSTFSSTKKTDQADDRISNYILEKLKNLRKISKLDVLWNLSHWDWSSNDCCGETYISLAFLCSIHLPSCQTCLTWNLSKSVLQKLAAFAKIVKHWKYGKATKIHCN